MQRFILENAWTTQQGFFGCDEHEFINRRVFLARQVDDYLVYHQGGKNARWLARLDTAPDARPAPAIAKLLESIDGYYTKEKELKKTLDDFITNLNLP